MNSDAIISEIKLLLIETLDLEDISVDDISDTDPLFNEGLGLDSIDALEIGIALQKKYGIALDPESEEIKHHFSSVTQLAQLVTTHAKTGS